MALSNQPNLMLTKNFHQLQTEVRLHVEADQVAQGSYETCFIGCLAKQEDSPEFIEKEYGIFLAVSRIAEAIFENLPSDEVPLFFAAFPSAVESDGKDLSRVVWQFLAAELRSLPPATPEIQAVIDTVIDGMDLLSEGKEWPEEDAIDAAYWPARADWAARSDAAYWAARAVYWAASADWAASANWAARAVYWAARAAAKTAGEDARLAALHRQRDLLLTLIAEAPVVALEVE